MSPCLSGVNAVDTKSMDRNRKEGEGIENGMCTQRMRGRAREKEREREKEQERRNKRDTEHKHRHIETHAPSGE